MSILLDLTDSTLENVTCLALTFFTSDIIPQPSDIIPSSISMLTTLTSLFHNSLNHLSQFLLIGQE